MQAQSRLAVNSVSSDEHEAVIRELTRGHELTAQLQEAAMRALRGQGQSEATAAFILREVSRAFTVCLSIMSSPSRAPPAPPLQPEMPGSSVAPAVAPRRNRDDSIPRKTTVTSTPHFDGYQWRKYGQKRITNTSFPRCYYRCSYHRGRNCPATKQVQQRSNGDPPQYVVMYVNEHTCDTPTREPEAAATATAGATNPLLDERGAKEEHERMVLVSSLACVLGGQSPAGSGSDVAVLQEPQGRTGDASASAPSVSVADAPGPPRPDVDAGLDVMDYEVTGALCFRDSYWLSDDGLPF